MRAGKYAVVDGVEYEAKFRDDGGSIVIVIAPGQQPPADVVPERYYDGTLQARVERARASRLFEVETWALLHGRFPVRVHHVDPDGGAAVALPLVGFTPLGRPVKDEQNRQVIPPGFSGHAADTWRLGGADPGELSNVHETVRELPVPPPD